MTTPPVQKVEIDRGLFLKVRCAYIRTMRARGEQGVIGAVNIHDEMQAQLIAMTEPRFGDGTVDRDIAALVAMLPAASAQRVIALLCNTSADYSNMVDAACDAEADRILEMSDEELNAEMAAHGADVERINKWSAATGRWIRLVCETRAELAREREMRERAERAVGEAVAWQRDSGTCLFCAYRESTNPKHEDCALVDQGYIIAAGYLEPEGQRVARLASARNEAVKP